MPKIGAAVWSLQMIQDLRVTVETWQNKNPGQCSMEWEFIAQMEPLNKHKLRPKQYASKWAQDGNPFNINQFPPPTTTPTQRKALLYYWLHIIFVANQKRKCLNWKTLASTFSYIFELTEPYQFSTHSLRRYFFKLRACKTGLDALTATAKNRINECFPTLLSTAVPLRLHIKTPPYSPRSVKYCMASIPKTRAAGIKWTPHLSKLLTTSISFCAPLFMNRDQLSSSAAVYWPHIANILNKMLGTNTKQTRVTASQCYRRWNDYDDPTIQQWVYMQSHPAYQPICALLKWLRRNSEGKIVRWSAIAITLTKELLTNNHFVGNDLKNCAHSGKDLYLSEIEIQQQLINKGFGALFASVYKCAYATENRKRSLSCPKNSLPVVKIRKRIISTGRKRDPCMLRGVASLKLLMTPPRDKPITLFSTREVLQMFEDPLIGNETQHSF